MVNQFFIPIRLTIIYAFLSAIIIPQMVKIVSAESYYIALTGSDSHDGSRSAPWRTLAHAWRNSTGGDTVFVRSGNYSDKQIWLVASQRGIGNKNTFWTLINYPGETCVFTDTRFIIDDDYVRIQGLQLTGSSFIQAVSWSGLHEHVEIIGNTFTGSAPVPIYFNANRGRVEANQIRPITATHGIYVMHGDSNVIRNNAIKGIDKYGIHIYDERKYGHPTKITNLLVENNVVDGSKNRSGIIVSAGESIDYSIEIEGIVIRGNVVVNHAEDGITIRYYGIIRNVEIIHNTVCGNKAYGLRISAADVDEITVKNNIFSFNRRQIAVSSKLAHLVFSHNLYWQPASSGIRNADAHAVYEDPLFVNKKEGNYHLQKGSPAIDAGIEVGISYHGLAPDLGAFEYDSSCFP